MMRSRTIREGSVGLLILLGLGLFGLLVLWLRGLNVGNRSYRAVVEFANVEAMQVGAAVRYRGVTVGEITAIRPRANVVEVDLEIESASVIIPRDVLIEANQSGFIGETSIDITPLSALPTNSVMANAIQPGCNSNLIVCDGDRLQGAIGVSFNELLRSTIKLTNLITEDEFFGQIRILTRNSADAAASVATLSREVTNLSRSVQQNLNTLTTSANASTSSIARAADQVGLTAVQVNELLAANRVTLVSTLNNLNQASNQIQLLTGRLSPVFDQVEQGQFTRNLDLLSANAAEASNNLRNLSLAVGSTDNLLLLQQTLDSARATFQNAQKITADLDELTGDPEFRQDIRDLVDGLNSLVSSTEQLQQQTELAEVLTPLVPPIAAAPETDSAATTHPEAATLEAADHSSIMLPQPPLISASELDTLVRHLNHSDAASTNNSPDTASQSGALQ
jgi:phospholipid/cholesterol/gamma-HCH transport system substrate-binding protein